MNQLRGQTQLGLIPRFILGGLESTPSMMKGSISGKRNASDGSCFEKSLVSALIVSGFVAEKAYN